MTTQKDKQTQHQEKTNSKDPSKGKGDKDNIAKQSNDSSSVSVSEMMKDDIATSYSGMNIQECADLMVKNDCGEIPVVESQENKKIIGVITDRDIACRVVAKGINPSEAKVEDYMTKNIYTVKKADDLEHCKKLMSEHQVRRLPVVDDNMNCIGIVSQAHTVRYASKQEVGELAKDFSRSKGEHTTQNIKNM